MTLFQDGAYRQQFIEAEYVDGYRGRYQTRDMVKFCEFVEQIESLKTILGKFIKGNSYEVETIISFCADLFVWTDNEDFTSIENFHFPAAVKLPGVYFFIHETSLLLIKNARYVTSAYLAIRIDALVDWAQVFSSQNTVDSICTRRGIQDFYDHNRCDNFLNALHSNPFIKKLRLENFSYLNFDGFPQCYKYFFQNCKTLAHFAMSRTRYEYDIPQTRLHIDKLFLEGLLINDCLQEVRFENVYLTPDFLQNFHHFLKFARLQKFVLMPQNLDLFEQLCQLLDGMKENTTLTFCLRLLNFMNENNDDFSTQIYNKIHEIQKVNPEAKIVLFSSTKKEFSSIKFCTNRGFKRFEVNDMLYDHDI